MVSGEPAPAVTWGRNKGEVDDPEKYMTRYDERAQEHVLEVRNPSLNTTLNCIITTFELCVFVLRQNQIYVNNIYNPTTSAQ